MAEWHVGMIYKRNAFLIIFDAILRFWLKKSSYSTGFIRFWALVFSMCVLPIKLNVFCEFWGAQNAILTTFWPLLGPFPSWKIFGLLKIKNDITFWDPKWPLFGFLAPQKSPFPTGFIRFSTWWNAVCVLSINVMLFWYFLESFCKKGSRWLHKRQVL